MTELCEVSQFNLNHYIHIFKKKKKFDLKNIEDVENIINSEEYLDFINAVYKFSNSKTRSDNERLQIRSYSNADEIINQFLELILGKELYHNYTSHLQSKLRF